MKSKFIYLLGLSVLMACNDHKKNDVEAEDQNLSEKDSVTAQTYAELSIKEGGAWNGRKYEGGEFKNVDTLTLPASHTDHSYFIRYEGPGWENKNIGYRLYLDWRNAIDIFGKKVDTMVLQDVGQDNFDSYHESAPWGQDILKAGKSLGIGGYGRFVGDSVAHFRSVEKTFAEVANEEEGSTVNIVYSGWKTGDKTIDLDAELAIYPEDRYTKVTLSPSEAVEGLTTGIVKFEDVALIQNDSISGDWAYIASYGTQTLVNDTDKLGMAILYKKSEVEKIQDGPYDHLVIFQNTAEPKTYYLLGAWEGEKEGITSREDFVSSLNELVTKLNDGKLNP